MSTQAAWSRALISVHALLMTAAAASILSLPGSYALRAIWLTAALLPLTVALPGLAARQIRTMQWLALVLVIYTGAAAVEVVASLGTAVFAAALLMLALLELALLFNSSRLLSSAKASERKE